VKYVSLYVETISSMCVSAPYRDKSPQPLKIVGEHRYF
jgi:hypothetical protein